MQSAPRDSSVPFVGGFGRRSPPRTKSPPLPPLPSPSSSSRRCRRTPFATPTPPTALLIVVPPSLSSPPPPLSSSPLPSPHPCSPPRPSISFPPLSSLPRPPWPVLRTSTCRPQFPSPPPPHKSDDLQVLFHPVSRSDGNLMVASHVLLLVIFSCGSVCRWQWRLRWILT